MINQLSVFVENKPGRMDAIINVLDTNKINITALSLADTSDFGMLRLIVDEPEKARAALLETGVMVRNTQVVSAEMNNVPGGLAKLMNILTTEGVSVEYMYAFLDTNGGAKAIIRADDNEKAEDLFKAAGITVA